MENQSSSENVPKSVDTPEQTPPSDYTPPADYNPPPSDYQIGIKQQPANMPPSGGYPPAGPGYPQAGFSPERFFTSDRLPKLIIYGIILMYLGAIIIVAVTTPGPPNSFAEKYDGDNDGNMDSDERNDYNQDRETYDTVRDIGVIVGKIIFNIGMLIILLVLLAGGFINRHLDKHIRLAMILSAGLIIAWSGLMT